MDMLGTISRSEVMRSKFRNALRFLIDCSFALFLKKNGCLSFQEWNFSGGEKCGLLFFCFCFFCLLRITSQGREKWCARGYGDQLCALFPPTPRILV